jgi:hypothetical protein
MDALQGDVCGGCPPPDCRQLWIYMSGDRDGARAAAVCIRAASNEAVTSLIDKELNSGSQYLAFLPHHHFKPI